jgi:hypothetical protein
MQSFYRFQTLPTAFTVPNLALAVDKTFPCQCNSQLEAARESMYVWYERFKTHATSIDCADFLTKSRFDSLAALSFPAANLFQLEACLMFYLWAFVVDDLADEGEGQASTDAFEYLTSVSMEILLSPDRDIATDIPYANMLKDLIQRLRTSGSNGMIRRFIRGFDDWSSSQISQSRSRTSHTLPSVEEFIVSRRKTFGTEMATGSPSSSSPTVAALLTHLSLSHLALVEYTLNLDLPDFVMENAIVREMIDALFDISIWANDLCSFNVRSSLLSLPS